MTAPSFETDVAVIGAGPAGAAAGVELARLGVREPFILERHDSPRDKTCGSGLSPAGIGHLRELGVWDDVAREAYPIRGLRLVTPGGREAVVSGGRSLDAVVCRRSTLDHLVLSRAVSLGARFLPRFDAHRLIERNGRVEGVIARDGRSVRAKVVIIAGGTHCGLVPAGRPRRVTEAIMGWWEGVEFLPHHVEMIFDPMLRPLYGWLFPESERLVNIGITYEQPSESRVNARALFDAFLAKHYGARLAKATPVGAWKGHPIAYSYRIERLTSPGRVVTGESALLTHPATAEGISQALRSGMMAARCARDIVAAGVTEERAFADYESECRRAFRTSFLWGKLFRGLIRTPAIDGLVALGKAPFVRQAAARLLASL